MRGRKIVLCVTGSVAAVETVKLVREMRRRGATVYCVMSKAACNVIHPDVLHWASDNAVVTSLTGACEHIKLCGLVPNKADLVIVAPSTANTIGKIANGIDDTSVTTVVSTALGSKIPLVVVPAMHYSLYDNPFVKENISRLRKKGVDIIMPMISENKAKFPEVGKIVDILGLRFVKKDLKGKKILVTAGSTVEDIDAVRFISNRSSGKMGIALANEAFARGAEVVLVRGHVSVYPKYPYDEIAVRDSKEMHDTIRGIVKDFDVVVHCAAVSDFRVEKFAGKVESGKKLSLDLKPTEKILVKLKKWNKKAFVVGFKAEHGSGELVEKSSSKLKFADIVVANDISKDVFGSDYNEVIIVSKKKNIKIPRMHKKDIANKILDLIKK